MALKLMPLYQYVCPNGHLFDAFTSVSNHESVKRCACGEAAPQRITAPAMLKIAPDVCYDSPIDGQPITSWAAREEDLKRAHCRPYDPEMKTDYYNRLKREDTELDQSIDQQVGELVHHMPTAQRGKLWSELTEQGVDAVYARGTPIQE